MQSGIQFFRKNTGLPIGVPKNGLLAHLQPSGMNVTGNLVTSWRNEATGFNILGGGYHNANDLDFNGHSSYRSDLTLTIEQMLAPIKIAPTTGLTIVTVSKIDQQNNGPMWWNMTTSDGTIDLWQKDGFNIGLNGFSSECYGPSVPNGVGVPLIITTTIPSSNFADTRIYVNGTSPPMLSFPPFTRPLSGSLSFSYVPSSSGYSFRGKHSTIIVYNRILSSPELNLLHNILLNKYKL